MRVFPIEHILRLFVRDSERLGERDLQTIGKILRYKCIIGRRIGKRLIHEIFALILSDHARRKIAQNAVIVVWIADSDGMHEVARRRIQQSNAAHVDVSSSLLKGNPCLHVLAERIEIDNNELNGEHLCLGAAEFLELRGRKLVCNDSGIDGGMHGADLSAEWFGIPRELVRRERCNPRITEYFASSFRRNDLVAVFHKILAEFDNAVFVVDAYIRSFLFFHNLFSA